ncbi:MAG: mechanosensitive ion channel family protein [Psychromonas sp.]|nr:mechanosensitive ion channel family protein [Psychromonas sp.]
MDKINAYANELLNSLNSNNQLNYILLIIAITAVATLIWNYVAKKGQILVHKTNYKFDDVIWFALSKPVSWLIVWIGASTIVLDIISNSKFFALPISFAAFQKAIFLLLIASVLWRLVHKIKLTAIESDYRDTTTAHAMAKLAKLTIIILTSLSIVQSFGISLSGLLAFGGMGGLIVGMAAKDLLGNFFGAIMIYLDKPFKIGDWIRSPDRQIEGTVEKIGWRLTKIRTFDKRPLYVPNSLFTQIVLENATRMSNRRINETFGIRYKDINKIEAIISGVRNMLEVHEDIDQHQTLMVNLTTFNQSSIDFFIYTFTKTTNWIVFQKVKQDILLKVSEVVFANQAEFAFPTRVLQIDKDVAQPII